MMVERFKTIIRQHAGLLAALGLAAALKAILLSLDVVPFNADEAVVALMARHILQGERPVFFYGQAYLGSTDAWLIAGAFAVFGQQVAAVRLVQVLLYLGTIGTTYWLGMRDFDRWTAAVAALLLALPPVLMTLYTTATLGGYGETLLIGNTLMLWTLRLREAPSVRRLEWLGLGLLAGFGFWTFGLLGVYLAPVGVMLLIRRPTGGAGRLRLQWAAPLAAYTAAGLGFVLGSSPWWWATLSGAATLSELGGAAIAGAGAANPLADIGLRLFSLALFGTSVVAGLRPPWGVRWLGLPLAPFAGLVLIGALFWAIRSGRSRPIVQLWLGLVVTLCAAFLLTPFGNDPSGRYFLPLIPGLALMSAAWLNEIRARQAWAAWALAGGLLAFNVWGNLDSAMTFPPGLTTQFDAVAQVNQRDLPAVIAFLRARGETRGYSNYWVEFPTAFLSDEQLLFSAELPYHQDFRYAPRDNRYPAYRQAVDASPRAAYITTRHPALDERLRIGLRTLGVTFQEQAIGDFVVFYGLSRKVLPAELNVYEVSH